MSIDTVSLRCPRNAEFSQRLLSLEALRVRAPGPITKITGSAIGSKPTRCAPAEAGDEELHHLREIFIAEPQADVFHTSVHKQSHRAVSNTDVRRLFKLRVAKPTCGKVGITKHGRHRLLTIYAVVALVQLALQRNTEFEAKESIRLPKSDSSRRSLHHSLSRFRITSVVAYSRISNAQHYTQTANPQMTHKHLTECGSVRIDQQRQSGAKRNADAPIPPGACGVMRTFGYCFLEDCLWCLGSSPPQPFFISDS
jgi:hypothetical protein